nr:hypothetical protein [Tanacetum cinerariifolium]
MYVIEQPILLAHVADSAANVLAEWNAIYDAHNEVACLMLGSMNHELHKQCENYSSYEMLRELKSMFEKQARVERFDLIQTFHACKQDDGKPVSTYVLKLKDYVEQLERLGYVLPQDLCVGLILNGLTSDFVGFVRNYNMHNMGKTIGELHALLIEYEKGLPIKTATPQVMAIQGSRIQKANKKSQKAKGKGKGKGKGKDKSYIPNPKNPKPSSKEHPKNATTIKSIGIYEIDMSNLVPNVNSIYNVSNKRVKHNLDSTYLWHCRLAHISKKHIKKMKHEGLLKSTDDESFDQCVSCVSGKMIRKSFPHRPERATDLLGLIHTDVCGPLRHVSRQESTASILNMVPTKKVDKTPYKLWYGKVPNLSYLKVRGCEARVKQDTPDKLQQRYVKYIFIGYPKKIMGYYFYFPPENKIVVARYAELFEKNLLSQEASRRAGELEEIQYEVTPPSEITSEIPMEVEGFEPPHEEEALVRRSVRTHRAPERLCLNVEVEEHNLGDLNESANYKAAMLDLEYNKWLDALNAKMQFMKDNQVWRLVDLPPNFKTVGVNGFLRKRLTWMALAIRVLIAITAYNDDEIWQMNVKTAFLNGYLDENIYMVQPEGFVDPKHPWKVCKLQRSIYGLKQASRSCNKGFDEEIKRFGFTQNLDEPSVYQKASRSNVTFLILYVDDIIIKGNHIPSLQSVKTYLGKCFAIKDLGEAAFILGIKIYRDRSKQLIGLS